MNREEAITKLVAYAFWASEHVPDEVAQALDIAIEALKEKRPRGEWICEGAMADYTNVLVYRCSICEEHFTGHEEDKKTWHFCPNCGADMREEGDSDA